MKKPDLILASSSPRRISMLTSIGLTIGVHPADIDETPRLDETPTELVLRLAEQKVLAIYQYYQTETIIGADTMVYCKNALLGKPPHDGAAKQMLQLLSNGQHEVYTGYCISFVQNGQRQQIQRCVQTKVDVKPLSEQEIQAYVASQQWRGKAGGYGIQGKFSMFVRSIQGSFDSVLGLPLCQIVEDLMANNLLHKEFPSWSDDED